MTYQAIRALVETQFTAAYQAMVPPVPVIYDNVQEESPNSEHVILSLGYVDSTEPVLCLDESMIETLRGALQVSCYVTRAQGMGRAEEMATVTMKTMNEIKVAAAADPNVISLNFGAVTGPTPVLSGAQPYALVTVSAPFTARV